MVFRHNDARLWMKEIQDSIKDEEFVKLLVTLWAIWLAERKIIHEEKFSHR